MSSLVVHKGRTNVTVVDLGINVTGDSFTSEIREKPSRTSPLIATWVVTVTNAASGLLKLTLDDSITTAITHTIGYMDIKRNTDGEPVTVFDRPVRVEFRETVTV